MIPRLTPARVPRYDRATGLELAARQGVDGLHAGRHRSRRVGSSLDFADHRAYQQGDDPGDIDWRAYVRTDRLLVRRWHDDRQLPVALLLDTSASMAYGTPAKGEHARLAAAILGLLALDQGDALRLLCSAARDPRPARSVDPQHLCLQLSQGMDEGDQAAAALLERATAHLEQRHLLVLLGDLLEDPAPVIEAAGRAGARGHEVAVLQVLDPTELALPTDWGPSLLTDPEGRVEPVTGDAADLAAAYAEALTAHQTHLVTGLRAVGAEHRLLPTDGEAATQVAAWLAGRSFR